MKSGQMPNPDFPRVSTNAAANDDTILGQSALLLVESLMHRLVECEVLPLADAIEIIETACDVLNDANVEQGLDTAACARSAAPLRAISASLRIDTRPSLTQP